MTRSGELGSAKLPGAEINRWTLRFRSPGVERDFDQQWLDQSLLLIRLWSVIGIACFVGFGLAEWWIYPANVGASFALRYGVILPIQLAFYAVTYTRWHLRTHAYNLVICTFITNAAYLYLLAVTPFPHSTIYYFMMLLIVLFTNGFVGVRFVHSFVASYLTFGCYALVTLAINPLSPKTSAVLLTVLFLAITIAVFSTYNQEIHIRRDFRMNKLLVLQKRESEELARQATAASEAKSRFLAMMSHELRTPLNAIIGFAEIISAQMFGPVQPDRYREYAQDIGHSGRHLLALINDILDLSKASDSQARLRDTQVWLADIVDFAVRLAKPRADEAKVKVEVDISADLPSLRADERMLRQIVINLLSNAVKFTPAGGRIEITARREPEGDMLLSISDTGIGIAPQDMVLAMTPFGQVDSTLARKYEGTGLGLPLAKSLAELHGGTLSLASQLGQGTTATLRFPATRVEPAPQPLETAAADRFRLSSPAPPGRGSRHPCSARCAD